MFVSVPISTVDALEARVERADALDLAAQLVGVDVVAEAVRRRVVGDREVRRPALARRQRHLLDGVAPVGQDRVAVQVAAQVGLRRSGPARRRRS